MRTKADFPVLYVYIGGKIREERRKANLSQEELSDKACLARTTITHIEEAKFRISVDSLYRIAKVLNIQPSDLLPPLTDTIMLTEAEAFLLFLKERRT